MGMSARQFKETNILLLKKRMIKNSPLNPSIAVAFPEEVEHFRKEVTAVQADGSCDGRHMVEGQQVVGPYWMLQLLRKQEPRYFQSRGMCAAHSNSFGLTVCVAQVAGPQQHSKM